MKYIVNNSFRIFWIKQIKGCWICCCCSRLKMLANGCSKCCDLVHHQLLKMFLDLVEIYKKKNSVFGWLINGALSDFQSLEYCLFFTKMTINVSKATIPDLFGALMLTIPMMVFVYKSWIIKAVFILRVDHSTITHWCKPFAAGP